MPRRAHIVTNLRSRCINTRAAAQQRAEAWHGRGVPLVAPPLLPPLMPVHVVRAYREAPPYAPGGRRSVRLAGHRGDPIVAPCTGRISFVGTVAGSPTMLSLQCDHGLMLTVRHIAASRARGELALAGTPLGRASGAWVGLSARRATGRYLDPMTLIGGVPRSRPPVLPPAARRPPTLPRVRLDRSVRTLSAAHASAPATPAGADLWLGGAGAALGGTLLLGAAYASSRGLHRRHWGVIVHRVASRR